MRISPGESVQLTIIAVDELGNAIHSVSSARSIAKFQNGSTTTNHLDVANRYYVLNPHSLDKNITLSYKISDQYYQAISDGNITHEIQFIDSYSSFVASASLKIKPILCRPGFRYASDQKDCVCDTSIQYVER